MRGALRRLLSRFAPQPHPAPMEPERLALLETIIGHRFRDRSLLIASLMHRSYYAGVESNVAVRSNERMEFLGDSVLSLVVNDSLYHRYPDKTEGELTKMKSVIVSKQALADRGKELNLGAFVLVSDNAQRAGVQTMDSVLSDTLEAVFGAIFIDGGYETARRCILKVLPDDLEDETTREDSFNYKSHLQEYIQALHKVPPRYRVHSTTGPDHDKLFVVEVVVKGNILGQGTGKTKKNAEQEAAKEAYRRLINAGAEG